MPDELMEILHAQLTPETFEMLKEALNGTTANDQDDPDEEQDEPGLSSELTEKICQLVGPHLSDGDFEQFQQLLDGMSSEPANDDPPHSPADRQLVELSSPSRQHQELDRLRNPPQRMDGASNR